MADYRRRVTSGEKSMVAFNELRPPFAIQMVVEGIGDPAPEALYEALEATTTVNPGSALRLEESVESGDFWVPGPPPTFTVVDDPDFRAQGSEEAPFLRWRLDAKAGPTCELIHVRGAVDADGVRHGYLIFRALHGVMDGQGTLLWASDFMRCLRGEPPLGHPSTLDVQTLCEGERGNPRPLPKPDALHPLGPPSPMSKGGYGWRRVSIPRSLSSDASGRVALALAAAAVENNGGSGPVRLHLPNDLRVHCPEERSTANLFGSLFLDVEPEMTAQDIGHRIVKMLYEREGQRPAGLYPAEEAGSMAAHRVKAYWDLTHLHDTGRYAFSATLSHLGRLKSSALSGPDWRATSALFVPLIGDACVVSLNGFDDRTEVAVGVSARFHGEGRLERLAATLRDSL